MIFKRSTRHVYTPSPVRRPATAPAARVRPFAVHHTQVVRALVVQLADAVRTAKVALSAHSVAAQVVEARMQR